MTDTALGAAPQGTSWGQEGAPSEKAAPQTTRGPSVTVGGSSRPTLTGSKRHSKVAAAAVGAAATAAAAAEVRVSPSGASGKPSALMASPQTTSAHQAVPVATLSASGVMLTQIAAAALAAAAASRAGASKAAAAPSAAPSAARKKKPLSLSKAALPAVPAVAAAVVIGSASAGVVAPVSAAKASGLWLHKPRTCHKPFSDQQCDQITPCRSGGTAQIIWPESQATMDEE